MPHRLLAEAREFSKEIEGIRDQIGSLLERVTAAEKANELREQDLRQMRSDVENIARMNHKLIDHHYKFVDRLEKLIENDASATTSGPTEGNGG